jgi:hypothetical protein
MFYWTRIPIHSTLEDHMKPKSFNQKIQERRDLEELRFLQTQDDDFKYSEDKRGKGSIWWMFASLAILFFLVLTYLFV